MRRARRSSLLALLPLTLMLMGQAGPEVTPAQSEQPNREESARRQVEDAERVRSMQIDAQRAATEQAAQALAEEQRLTAAQSEAFERLKRAEAAVEDMTRHMLDLNQRRAEAQNRIDKRVAALRPLLPVVVRMSEYPVETLLGTRVPAEDAIRGILVLRT